MSLVRSMFLALTALFLAACGGGGGGGSSTSSSALAPQALLLGSSASSRITIRVLSSKPEYVSGNDARIEVTAPQDLQGKLEFLLNGYVIHPAMAANGTKFEGIVDQLRLGDNTLTVRSTSGGTGNSASLTLTNYPITGPILSGPHLKPYECRTVENGLGLPLDADCSAATQVTWWYKSTNGQFLQVPDPSTRPGDVASTTTTEGLTVPYIVRVESGTINRGVYRVAVLDDPTQATAGAWQPSAAWNKRLVVSFGCCGSANYNQGVTTIVSTGLTIPYVLSDLELSKGYAFAISSELWNNQHANPHLQGETLMMLKEHLIEEFGVPKWTAGKGGSGGAIQQYLIAQLFPGLLDGLQPSISFPESLMPAVAECRLFQNIFTLDPLTWTTEKQVAAMGFNDGTCQAWDTSFTDAMMVAWNKPQPLLAGITGSAGCGLRDATLAYDPVLNPTGARCSILDAQVNLMGIDPVTGFTRRPIDNIGVQYGLASLKAGKLTLEEFLTLNEKMGGFDRDGNVQAARMSADPEAVRRAYAGGLVNSMKLPPIPIITQRTNADSTGDIHDSLQDLTIRARLQRANGRSDNQIILKSGGSSGVDMEAVSLDILTRWLDKLAADTTAPSFDKVARNKPADATDTCWDPSGNKIVETITTDPNSACNKAYPLASNPHIVAGQSLTNDVLKCQLRPLDFSEYGVPVSLTQQARLRALYPNGVCDYGKPGVSQVPLQGTYLRLPLM